MRKLTVILAAAAIMAAAVTGCVPKEQTNIQINPDFSEQDHAELDFTELHNDTIALFADSDAQPYVFIDSVDISGDNKNHTIFVDATAVEGTTAEDAQHFATAVLRHMNDAATEQYTGYELSTPKDFGKLFNDYSVTIAVTGTDDASMIYQIELPAGKEIPLSPNIEKYEDEWLKEREVYNDNVVYGSDGKIVYDPREED